ncbi:MAG: O-antigen ligase family protein [Flavobacteriales bacterium]|nr:O-antigen ligase family protein [Flavobacteriales bacterium]
MPAAKVCKALFRTATLLLACLPMLGMRPAVGVILLWVLSALLHRLLVRTERPAPDVRTFLFLASPFLLMMLDLLRASDPLATWHISERSSILAIAPFVIFMLRPPVDTGLRDRAVDVYAFASLALALFANFNILAHGLSADLPFAQAYRQQFSDATGIHPPFGAYFFLLGALFMVERALRTQEQRKLRITIALLLTTAGALIASRTPLIAFAMASLLMLWSHPERKRALRLAALLIGGLVLLIALIPSARQRALEPFRTDLAIPTAGASNSVSERFVIGHCTLELLENNWLLGLGQAAVQPALDTCYEQFNDPRFLNGSYSTHCQPLHWWLSFGMLGALLFVALFFVPLRKAWGTRDARLAGFLLFVLVCCLTENVLARQWGVVLFAFFLALLSPSLFAGAGSAAERSQR